MRRTADEHLIERYLGGEMSGAEEQEFFMRVAVDSNLRQTLKAYRIVESAIRKHRDSIAPEHSTSRLHLLGMLENPASVPHTATVVQVSESAGRTGLAGSLGRRWLALGVVATMLVTTVALWTSRSDEPSILPASRPAATQPRAPIQRNVEQTAPEERVTATAERRDAKKNLPAARSAQPSGNQPVRTAPPPVTQRQVVPAQVVTPKTTATTVDIGPKLEKPPQPVVQADQKRSKPLATPDTIKMRMKIALPDTKDE